VVQNRLLTEDVALLLTCAGFDTYCHRLVPPNDGGLALGQAAIAGKLIEAKDKVLGISQP
jgi:hydrogenase maturation protein HypF